MWIHQDAVGHFQRSNCKNFLFTLNVNKQASKPTEVSKETFFNHFQKQQKAKNDLSGSHHNIFFVCLLFLFFVDGIGLIGHDSEIKRFPHFSHFCVLLPQNIFGFVTVSFIWVISLFLKRGPF